MANAGYITDKGVYNLDGEGTEPVKEEQRLPAIKKP